MKRARKPAKISFSSSSESSDEEIKKVPVKRNTKNELVDASDDAKLSSLDSPKDGNKQAPKSGTKQQQNPGNKQAPKADGKQAPKADGKQAPKADNKPAPAPKPKATPQPKDDDEYSYSYSYSYSDANARRTEAKTPMSRPRTAVSDRFPLFRCHRKKTFRSLSFEYHDRQNLLFTCQRKGSKFPICKAGESDPLAVFTSDRRKLNFVLTDAKTGHEIASVTFSQTLVTKPKDVVFTMRNGDSETRLVSKPPIFNERKLTWQLDFGGRFVEPSLKNVLLLDEDQEISAIVYKLKDDDLQVEVAAPIDELLMFFFAAAVYVCPI